MADVVLVVDDGDDIERGADGIERDVEDARES